ncbi:MAG TPA: hypothetical protein VF879_02380 [Nitrospirales bacterium]
MLAIALANKLARIAWAPFHTVAPISRGSSPLPRDKGSLRFTKGMPATKLIDQPIDRSWREPTESWLVSVGSGVLKYLPKSCWAAIGFELMSEERHPAGFPDRDPSGAAQGQPQGWLHR